MYGTIFLLTDRHQPKVGEPRNIPSLAIKFSDLPEDTELTAGLALEFFKNARKSFKLIRGREFIFMFKGQTFFIDRYGKTLTIYALKEITEDAIETDG